VLAAYTRQPFDTPAPVPIITEPLARLLAELATLEYELVLQTLNRFFTQRRDQRTAQQPYPRGGSDGGRASPTGDGGDQAAGRSAAPGLQAGFAFEMFYAMGNLL
jgi:hypothetical protein